MASRSAHDAIGFATGFAATLFSARNQGRRPSFWELLGGALGGLGGSHGPDAIEPAYNPHQRQFAHSATLLIGGGVAAFPTAFKVQGELARSAELQTDPVMRAITQLASGAAVGLPAGYASHVVADATTPRGIPPVGRFGGR